MSPATFDLPECIECGALFEPTRPWQLRCNSPSCKRSSKAAHAARTAKRAQSVPTFVGVDGEGVQVGTEHHYVLLSVGNNSFHKNGAHLSFIECMEFLYSCFEPDATYVGYFLNYDFTQWLRTLPEERARMLLTPEGIAIRRPNNGMPVPFPVRWQGWEFDLMAGRRFKLRPEGQQQWMYICDVGPFFQMPFVKASAPDEWIDEHGKHIEIATAEEQEIIARGKARRADAQFDLDMIEYNQAENRVLARMMTVMADGFQRIGVKLNKTQWFGPGQAVQVWMKEHNSHTREAVAEATPTQAMELARASFFGGWFEIMRHGHIPGTTYEYDINSAYPSVHSKLPCLLHGEWKFGKGKLPKRYRSPDRYTLVSARVEGVNRKIGAMLHRTAKGKVLRPWNTSGVYWWHELEAAIDATLVEPDRITFHEWASYKPCACHPPMEQLANLFHTRVAVGKATPQGKSLKLLYNSAYGKTAQSVGEPKFANPIHASLITSGCRTQILRAIATHPERAHAVVMVATDGIYFDSPHPTLDIGKGLGQWEADTRENMCLVMPGVYWDDRVRSDRARAKIKSRGVNAQALLAMIDEFDDKLRSIFDQANADEWPKVDVKMNFAMVTARQAIMRNDWTQCGFVQQGYIKTLSSKPHGKRQPLNSPLDEETLYSRPWRMPETDEASTPYRGSFGAEFANQNADIPLGDDGLSLTAFTSSVLYEF